MGLLTHFPPGATTHVPAKSLDERLFDAAFAAAGRVAMGRPAPTSAADGGVGEIPTVAPPGHTKPLAVP